MRLVVTIEDDRFQEMGLSDSEILDIIRQEIADDTYPLAETVRKIAHSDNQSVEIKPVRASGREVVPLSESEILDKVMAAEGCTPINPKAEAHGAV